MRGTVQLGAVGRNTYHINSDEQRGKEKGIGKVRIQAIKKKNNPFSKFGGDLGSRESQGETQRNA